MNSCALYNILIMEPCFYSAFAFIVNPFFTPFSPRIIPLYIHSQTMLIAIFLPLYVFHKNCALIYTHTHMGCQWFNCIGPCKANALIYLLTSFYYLCPVFYLYELLNIYWYLSSKKETSKMRHHIKRLMH